LVSDATLFSGENTVVRTKSPARWRNFAQAIHPRRHPLAFVATVVVLTMGYGAGMHATFLNPWSTSPQPEAIAPVVRDVAMITGMHDVQWAAAQAPRYQSERIATGNSLHLVQGVLELTFDSGVRVVIEGPAEFRVEDTSQSRLSRGKLVAFVPEEGRGFTLHTPAARVVDLGTEFGVICEPTGVAQLTVFQGSVEVSPPANAPMAWKKQLLLAGQSRGFDRHGPSKTHASIVAGQTLVRALPSNDLSLDIADIVAGGSGRGRAINRGLDLQNGSRVLQFREGVWATDGKYHAVDDSLFVDGVFIIRGDGGPQIIAAGEVLSFSFPAGTGSSWGHIWSWEPKVDDPRTHTWIHSYPHNPGRLIAMHANAGMTIDLQEVRAAYPDHNLRRLLGYVVNEFVPSRGGRGNATGAWVIVDGQARITQPELRSGNEPARVDVALTDDDRFLTLAATDGGDGLTCDFVMWKHLRLLLEPLPEVKLDPSQ
jgi:hypothetical protein